MSAFTGKLPNEDCASSEERLRLQKNLATWSATKTQQSAAEDMYTKAGDPKMMVHNTNVLKVGISGSADSDRHCYRPSTRTGTMKCGSCYDYNKGVQAGRCYRCGK